MAQRVLVTLSQDTDVDSVKQALEGAGATGVTPPQKELPGVIVAEVPDDDDSAEAATRFTALDGVDHAEPDQFRFTQ